MVVSWADSIGLDSARTCPLCQMGAGTPRHVFMSCRDVAGLSDMVRDFLEAELARHRSPQSLIAAAEAWWAREETEGTGRWRYRVTVADQRRWPVTRSS